MHIVYIRDSFKPNIKFMKNVKILITAIAATLLISCGNNNDVKETKTVVEKSDAVAVYDKIPVRTEANKKAKYITGISFGETVSYLGTEKIDSTDKNRKYYKVELSDGTNGWASAYGLVTKSSPACIIESTYIYSRPDVINKTSKELNVLDFVVITEKKGEWASVVGLKKRKKGWIKVSSLSESKEEITISVLAYKDKIMVNGDINFDKLSDFIKNAPYKGTKLINYLSTELSKKQQESISEIEEEIIETVDTEE